MILIFATANQHKFTEIQKLLPPGITALLPSEKGFTGSIPETGTTLEENAIQKARFIYDKYLIDCFSDDTGLMVDALEGAPGELSARYAGPDKNSSKNITKLINNLQGRKERKAQFKTVIAAIIKGKEYWFEGIVFGTIANERHGINGFGYDSVFIPQGYNTTFAGMTLKEKNKLSHRAMAVNKLVEFLISLPLPRR